MEKLKSCPFCGSEARKWENCGQGYSKYGRFWWNVGCDKCSFYFHDREEFEHTEDGRYLLKYPEAECIERWNTRTPLSPPCAEVVDGVAINTAHMEMPDNAKYLDEDIEFRNDLGKWAERNYRTIRSALALLEKNRVGG